MSTKSTLTSTTATRRFRPIARVKQLSVASVLAGVLAASLMGAPLSVSAAGPSVRVEQGAGEQRHTPEHAGSRKNHKKADDHGHKPGADHRGGRQKGADDRGARGEGAGHH